MASSTIKKGASVQQLTLTNKRTDQNGTLILSELGTNRDITIVSSRLIDDDGSAVLYYPTGNAKSSAGYPIYKLLNNSNYSFVTDSVSISGYIRYVSFT